MPEKSRKKVAGKDKISLPTILKIHLPGKAAQKVIDSAEPDDEM